MNAALFKKYLGILFWAAVVGAALFLLYLLSRHNYVLFHTLVEMAIVNIGIIVFIIAANTRKYARNDFFTFLGIAYLSVSALHFAHALTYKGVNIIGHLTSNPPTQLWLAARYLLAVSFLLAPLLVGRVLKNRFLYLMAFAYLAAATGALLSIFHFHNFPAAYMEGKGLTDFKIMSELVISAVFAGSILTVARKKAHLDKNVYRYFAASAILSVLAELSFTHYVSVYGYFNMVGHLLLVLSALCVYKALIEKTVKEPLAVLFKDLSDANQKLSSLAAFDNLTGLLNRRSALESIKQQFNNAARANKSFCVIMIDIDNLKTINDHYGHLVGDMVIKEFSDLLVKLFRKTDVIGRYGGDEFIICPLEMDAQAAQTAIADIMAKASEMKIKVADKFIKITASSGICQASGESDVLEIVYASDKNMLESKRAGKNSLTVSAGSARKTLPLKNLPGQKQ